MRSAQRCETTGNAFASFQLIRPVSIELQNLAGLNLLEPLTHSTSLLPTACHAHSALRPLTQAKFPLPWRLGSR